MRLGRYLDSAAPPVGVPGDVRCDAASLQLRNEVVRVADLSAPRVVLGLRCQCAVTFEQPRSEEQRALADAASAEFKERDGGFRVPAAGTVRAPQPLSPSPFEPDHLNHAELVTPMSFEPVLV